VPGNKVYRKSFGLKNCEISELKAKAVPLHAIKVFGGEEE
jgi:hypothetical protein